MKETRKKGRQDVVFDRELQEGATVQAKHLLLPVFATLTLLALSLVHASEDDMNVEATYETAIYPERFATGLVRTEESEAFLDQAPRDSFTFLADAVPKSSSLRGKAGPVENQGGCGACWVFALTTALRGTLKMEGRDPGRLSFNYMLNCTPLPSGHGCNGGDFAAADMLKSPKGAPAYGADGSYNGTSGSCVKKAVKASKGSYRLIGTNLGHNPGRPKPTFRDIAYAVGVLKRPVAVDINADSRFMSYKSGVFNTCASSTETASVNHMVVIEGYDCETAVDSSGKCKFDSSGNLPPGVGTWTIRNSWGSGWGSGGYVTMKATKKSGGRCNAVASDALYFQ